VEGEVPVRVLGKGAQHMVEKANAGVDVKHAGPIEVECHLESVRGREKDGE
jgi:hypothetical protein